MNKALPYCSCAISATRYIPGTLGRTAPGPLLVSDMHKTSNLWFAHSSARICCLAVDSPSMVTDITINAISVEETSVDILVGVVVAPL